MANELPTFRRQLVDKVAGELSTFRKAVSSFQQKTVKAGDTSRIVAAADLFFQDYYEDSADITNLTKMCWLCKAQAHFSTNQQPLRLSFGFLVINSNQPLKLLHLLRPC